MKSQMIIAFITLLSAASFTVSAQKSNLQDENQRIRQGVRSGELTRTEVTSLRSDRDMLRREALRYKTNDGYISKRERADLRRDARKFNRNVCHQKHDRQRRF